VGRYRQTWNCVPSTLVIISYTSFAFMVIYCRQNLMLTELLQAKFQAHRAIHSVPKADLCLPCVCFNPIDKCFNLKVWVRFIISRYVPSNCRLGLFWKTYEVRMEHHVKGKFIMCLLWAKIRLPLKYLVLTLLRNLIQIHRLVSFYLPSGRTDLRRKLKYANKLNCSKF